MRPESMATGRAVSWISIAALAIVPVLVAVLLLSLRPAETTVNAAIVNLDEPVTVAGEYIPMGRQMAAAIVDDSNDEISWTLANETNARDGLRGGDYSVVVTIPENFSAAATSFSENDADLATQATIAVDISENAPIADAQLGEQIAAIATGSLNSFLTETYLENVFVALNSVGDQFGEITEAVTQLSDGSEQLAAGADEAAEGAGLLSEGLGQLSDAGPELQAGGSGLNAGSSELVGGASQLAGGANELSGGASAIGSGADDLSAGAGELASGAGLLADGVDELAEQAPELVEGIDELAGGADALLGGIPAFAEGSKQVVLGVGQLAEGLEEAAEEVSADGIAEQFEPLSEGAAGVAAGASGVDSGLVAVNGTLSGLAGGNEEAQGAASLIATGVVAEVGGAFPCPPELDEATCGLLEDAFNAGVDAGANAGALEGFKAGAGAGVAALNRPQDGMTLIEAAGEISGGAAQLSAGIDLAIEEIPGQFEELSEGLSALANGANLIVQQGQPIVDNADSLGTGAGMLLAGINELNEQVGALPGGIELLSGGINQLSDGAGELSGGASQLAGGANELAGGASELAGGASQLSSGASQLSSGVSQYVDGVGQFVNGTTQAAENAPELADGLDQLADGAGELNEGVGEFADELEAGADEVPSYSDSDREILAGVIASPIEPPSGPAGFNSVATAALVLVGALWLASMLAFVMVRALPSNIVSSRASSLTLWARTVGLPALVVAAQGVIMGVIGGVVLSLGMGTTMLLGLALAVVAVSFVLTNHALTAWLGNVGRGIAVLLLVATTAIAVTSVGTGGFSWLDGISPLQNAFLIVRTLMADGSGMIGLLGGALLLGLIALAASMLAISSRRKLTPAQYRRHAVA